MGTLALLFTAASQMQGLPIGLLSALCYVESTHHVEAVNIYDGGSPSHGICQVKLGTARMLGFKGTKEELQNPSINIIYASKYLKRQLRRYNNDIRKGVSSYNSGTYKFNKNGAINQDYIYKVFKAWGEFK